MSKCVEPGLKCESCSQLVFCLGVGTESTLQSINLMNCNNSVGLYCSVGHGGCAKDPRVCDIFGLKDINCQVSGALAE